MPSLNIRLKTEVFQIYNEKNCTTETRFCNTEDSVQKD